MSYQSGKEFENAFEDRCAAQGWHYQDIPEGGRRTGGGFMPIKSPFDYIIAKKWYNLVAFVDVKSCSEGTFKASRIKDHQREALTSLHICGQTAGYVVWFSSKDVVVFFSADKLSIGANQGLRPEDGVHLGGVGTFSLDKIFPQKSPDHC